MADQLLAKETAVEEVAEETAAEESTGVKEYFCGVGRCRPKWMQIFRNAKFFTFILCLYSTIEGAIVSGFTAVVLSSIERRYQFSSVWAGLIRSVFDVAVLISVLFISYFGGRGHKPRWLGVSLVIQGIGAFVFSLPQFIFSQYETGASTNQTFDLCDSKSDTTSNCDSTTNTFALVLFFIGNALIGVGAAPLFTVGLSYLDDIVRPKYVSIHLGLVYAFTILGPAIGYGLGGFFLSIYVDPWVETTLEPSDPRWVGAWWLSFLLAGVTSLLFAVPFFMFPKLLPNSSLVKQERVKEMAQKYEGRDKVGEANLATKLKTFPRHLLLVLKTPSWVFITIAVCFSQLVVSGVTSFAPKYLESQFIITASRAGLLTGIVAIVGAGSGIMIGALIIYFSKSKGRRAALINWVITLVALFPTFIFIVNCPTLQLVGVNVEYPDSSIAATSTSALNSSCISHCDCDTTQYQPVCGEDNLTYFSPCTAGCLELSMDNKTKDTSFSRCGCVAERLHNSNLNTSEGTALEGRCTDQQCHKLEVFLVVIFFALVLLSVLQVPNIIITVRSVADEQRTLALGIQSAAFRLFGAIPGPLAFGAIFDTACIYWQYECSRRGNCWVYNNHDLSTRAVSLAMLGIGTNFVFSLLSWIFYPKQRAKSKLYEPLSPDNKGEEVLEENVVEMSSCNKSSITTPSSEGETESTVDSIQLRDPANIESESTLESVL